MKRYLLIEKMASAIYRKTVMKNNLFSLIFLLTVSFANAQATFTAIASASWDLSSTWTLTSGSDTDGIPDANDTVRIASGFSVTIPANYSAACTSLSINPTSGSSATSLTLSSSTSRLDVGGDVTITRPGNGNTTALNVAGGTVTVSGNVTLAGNATSSNRIAKIDIDAGTLTVSGNLIFNTNSTAGAATNVIDMSGGGGTLNLSGLFTLTNNIGTLTPGTNSTVNYNGTVAQTIPLSSAITYNNLTINNTHASGATLGAAVTATNITGSISVGNNTSGSLLNTNNLAVTFGNTKTLTVASGSTLNAGTSVITFGTSGNVNINGLFKTANTSGFSGTTSTAINSSNNPTITLGSNSTIEYSAVVAQTVTGRTYPNLTLSGSGTKTFGAVTNVTNLWSFNSDVVANLGGFIHNAGALKLGGSGQNSGLWGSTASSATFKSATYFGTSATGRINVSASCSQVGITISGSEVICKNETASYTATVTNGVSASYQWKVNGVNVGTNSATFSSATLNNNDVVTCLVTNGATTCFPLGTTATSNSITVSVSTITASATPSTISGGATTALATSILPTSYTTTLLNENFNGTPTGWTTTNGSTSGTPANAAWTLRPDGYFYDYANGYSPNTFYSNDNSQFYLTNSAAQGSGSTTSTILKSPAINTTGYTSLSLLFYQFIREFDTTNFSRVEVSTDNSNWTTLATYDTSGGDDGAENAFALKTINLSAYINQATLYIRFRYDAQFDWFWAIDNVKITGNKPVNYTYSWAATPSGATAGLPGTASTSSLGNATINATPTQTTSYVATAVNSVTSCTVASSAVVVTVTPPTTSGFSPTTACYGSGTSVVITGTGFTGATAVTFNGTVASFTVNSATQITATLPATATTGNIQVTTPAGTATSASVFTVNLIAVTLGATPTMVQGSATSINFPYTANNGQQSELTFDAAAIAAGISATTQSNSIAAGAGNIVIQLPFCQKAGTYNGTMYVRTFSPACSSTTYPFSINITSSAAPTGSATQVLCAGTTVASLIPNPGGASSIKWYAAATGGSALATTTALTTGTHYYASQTVGGCESTARLDATVTLTSPNNILTGFSSSGSFCSGGPATITFDANNLSGIPPYVLSYQNSSGTLFSATIPDDSATAFLVTPPPTVTTNYTLLSITDNNGTGCQRTTGFGDATATVTIATPQGSLTANGPFCATGAGQLTWTATAGTGPYTIIYNDGVANRTVSGIVSGTAFATFTTPVTSTTTYTLVSVAGADSCARTTGFTGATATITVNALPTASLISSDADNTFCTGTSVTFTASGGTNYNFKVGATSVQNSATATYTTTTLTNGQVVTVDVTNASGCIKNSTGITNTVNPTSVGGTISSSQTICSGVTPTALTLASNVGSVTKWQSSTDNFATAGTDIANTNTTLTLGTLTTTTYYRAIAQSGQCSTSNSSIATITVNPLTTSPTIGTITQPNCTTATASVVMSNLPSGPWTLTRSPDNTTTTGSGTSATISGLAPGTYTYVVESSGLKGDYFNNLTLTGSPVLTRTDANLNFDWGNGSPDTSVAADLFSVRWSGQIKPLYSENYTFYTRSDDGVRLWVNGIQIINDWNTHAAPSFPGIASSTIALTAGVKYDIVLEYYENYGQAVAQLSWSSTSQALGIIPQSNFYLSSSCVSPASSNVVINAQPTSPSITTAATPAVVTAVCQSSNAQTTTMAYTATTGTPTTYSIVWTGMANQGTTSFAFTPGAGNITGIVIPAGTAAGNYSGTMTISSANGCTATKTITVTILANPTPTFTTQPGATSCLNTDVTYTTQSGRSNYVWTVPGILNTDYSITSGGIGSSDNTVTLKWLTAGSKTVSINYTFNGCTAATATSSTVLVNSTYDTIATTVGTYTFCIDDVTTTLTTSAVNSGQYVVLDVIKGFTYSVSVGNVFAGNENLTILDDATNNVLNSVVSGASGATVSNWVSTISGRIKIFLTTDNCTNGTTGGTITLTLNNVGNTQDDKNAAGTNTWRGHVYNWTINGPPPGGNPSPTSPSATNPFEDGQYVGYYNVSTEALNETFGGDYNCFDVYSNGAVRSKIYTEKFAVRYRMKCTRAAGCYLITISGDDGVRLYVDNVKVFDEWKQQSSTTYQSILVYLNGNSDLILDFYENGGVNAVSFNITPFVPASNTVTAPATTTVCNAVVPNIINGSNYVYNGSTVNPTIQYQWQSAPDVSGSAGTWSDVTSGTGQTSEDYTPAAITGNTTTNITWYRRKASAVANLGSCSSFSNAISITTRPVFTSGEIASTGQIICTGGVPTTIGSTTAASGGNAPITYSWRSSADGYSAAISGATSATYLPPSGLTTTTSYRRYARDGSCNTTPTVAIGTWTITVNPLPTTPTIVSKTDIDCVTTTGSVNLSGLPSGSWTLNPGAISGSGTTYTRTGLAVGSYNFTVSNGCTSSPSSTVTISDLSTTTWNGTTWSNGTPDATKAIVIAAPLTILANITACSLTINSGITITVPSGITLTITNAVTTNGQLIFENNASLVQTTNAVNSGSIQYKRISNLMKNFDFSYWSSPVAGQTAKALSPNTLADKYFKFNGATNNWVFDDGVMAPGVGYIIRVPKPGTWPNGEVVTDPYLQPVTFTGVPNNGDKSFAVGANQYNLIGNPYPSAIDADLFINETNNKNMIYGALYFWTHNTAIAPSGAKYIYSSNDYATYTLTGGAAAATGGTIPTGKIAAGQSFFIANTAAGSFVFKNSMRVSSLNLLTGLNSNNSQFFKFSKTTKTTAIENNRVWLNLTNTEGAFKQLLVGYLTGATNDWDNLYDGPTFDGNSYIDFYSINKTSKLTIQGRALPFDISDSVPLGYRSTVEGPFEINIDNTDGELSNKEILLEDKKIGITHNLTQKKYSFTAIKGVENDRFVLKYANKELTVDKNEVVDQMVTVYVKNKKITINSTDTALEKVVIYDILGRMLYLKENINSKEFIPDNFNSSNQSLILKITLKDETQTTKKINF